MAVCMFTKEPLHSKSDEKTMHLTLDLTEEKDQQVATLVTFYKEEGRVWAAPFKCRLKGMQSFEIAHHFLGFQHNYRN